jgi:hypothetical protein
MKEFTRLIELKEADLPDVLQELVLHCRERLEEAVTSMTLDTKTGVYSFEFTSFTLDLKVNKETKQITIKNVKSLGGKDKATNAILNLVYIAKDLGYVELIASDVQTGAMDYWVTTLNFKQIDQSTAMRLPQEAELFDW